MKKFKGLEIRKAAVKEKNRTYQKGKLRIGRTKNQLIRSITSIPFIIAEGNS